MTTAIPLAEGGIGFVTCLPDAHWRPIETAPRDGSWILLTGGTIEYGWGGDDYPRVVSGQWSTILNNSPTEGHWQFAWYDGGYYGAYERPTHWMPIPPAPVSALQ